MGQRVQTATVPPIQLESAINSLANQNDDLLWPPTQTANGWFMLIFKPQAANWVAPSLPTIPVYGEPGNTYV